MIKKIIDKLENRTTIIMSVLIVVIIFVLISNNQKSYLSNKVVCAEMGAEYFEKMQMNQQYASFLNPKYNYNKKMDTCLISYFSVEDSGLSKVYGDVIVDIFTNKTLFYSTHYSIEDKIKQHQLNKDACEAYDNCLTGDEMQKKIDKLFNPNSF